MELPTASQHGVSLVVSDAPQLSFLFLIVILFLCSLSALRKSYKLWGVVLPIAKYNEDGTDLNGFIVRLWNLDESNFVFLG